MRVTSIPSLKIIVCSLEVAATNIIIKPIFNEKVDEYNIGSSSNAVSPPTFVSRLVRGEVLGCSMSHNFLCSGVVLMLCIAIGVANSTSVMSYFIVIADCVKYEVANHLSNLLTIIFEVLSPIDISQIFCECIAAASHDQI